MKHCATCGAEIPNDANYCSSCGAPLRQGNSDLAHRAGLRTTAERVDMRIQELRKSQKGWNTSAWVCVGVGVVAVVFAAWIVAIPMIVASLIAGCMSQERKEEADNLQKLR